MSFPGQISIAAAPTLPSCADPSEYTLIFSVPSTSAVTEAFLSFATSILKGHLCCVAGLPPVVGTVSSALGFMLKVCIKSCRGDLCLFVVLAAQVLASL